MLIEVKDRFTTLDLVEDGDCVRYFGNLCMKVRDADHPEYMPNLCDLKTGKIIDVDPVAPVEIVDARIVYHVCVSPDGLNV